MKNNSRTRRAQRHEAAMQREQNHVHNALATGVCRRQNADGLWMPVHKKDRKR